MSSTSTPPPRPATRPQHRPSTSNNVNLHSRQERQVKSPRRSASGSPHGSNSSRSSNTPRRVRPEITIVSAQPMSTHPAFADGRKGGYIPPEAPPSYDDALRSSVPLDPMFTDPAIPDHISANLRAFPRHQVQSGLHSSSLPVIHTESLPPPQTVTSSSSLNVIAPTPRTRRNIGNTNNSNNTNETVTLDGNTSSTTEDNSVPENQNTNKENISPSRKPEVPTKPKNLRKADTSTTHQSQVSGTSSNIQTTSTHSSANQNKIQKRVAVNPELTEVEVHNQEEFHKKKQIIIERLKQLKEEQKKSDNKNIQSENMDDKKIRSENSSHDNSEVKKPTSRRLPPPPRPPSLPSVKPRSVHPVSSANASKQSNKSSTEQKVQNNESKNSSNHNVNESSTSTQFGMLINFDDDGDDPYATIDHMKDSNKMKTGESSQSNKEVKHMSNVDLLCFELGPKPEKSVIPVHKQIDNVENDKISENVSPNEEIPMTNISPKPAPRKTKHESDNDDSSTKPEDVYAVVRKPRKSIKKNENSTSENKSEEAAVVAPPVPSSRPPPSDYEGMFVDAEDSEEAMTKSENNKPNLPITAPPRTKRVHRNSSSKTPEITRRNQTEKTPDPVRRHSSQKTPETARKLPPRPAPPPIPSSKPKATQDDAVVYSKNKHVTIESPPEQATVVLRNKNNAEPKKRSKSFKINRKSLGFFSSSKKDDGNSSSTSSSSEKKSPKVRPKSTMFPSRSDNKLKLAKPPVDNNPTGRKPLRSAPPRPTRPAPPKPGNHQSNNNNSSEDIHKIANPVPKARPRSKSMAAKCASMQSESVQTERPPPPNRPAPTRSKSVKPLRPPPVKVTKEMETQTVSFDLGGESIMTEHKNELNNEIKVDEKPQHISNQKPLGKVCAKFCYESNESGDLEFNNGDIIVVISEVNSEWYKGKLNDKIGIFPKAYVGELKSVPPKRPQLLRRPTNKPETKTDVVEKVTQDEDTKSVSKPHYDPTTPDWGDDDDEDHTKEVQMKNWDVADLDLSPVPAKRVDVHKHNEEFFDAVEDLHSRDDLVDGFEIKQEKMSHEIENINGIIQNTHALDFHDEELTHTDVALTVNHVDDEDVIANDFIEYIEPKCAVAIYKFEGTVEEELSFEAGNIITVLGEVNDEWLKGEFHGKSGIFPSNFIQEIKDS